jgi:hypothetical protein
VQFFARSVKSFPHNRDGFRIKYVRLYEANDHVPTPKYPPRTIVGNGLDKEIPSNLIQCFFFGHLVLFSSLLITQAETVSVAP